MTPHQPTANPGASGSFDVLDYFAPPDLHADRSFLDIAEAIERAARIEDHPFFPAASQSRALLVNWATQEAMVTNPFSQILFRVLANIKNVHIRSILLPVVEGEHSRLRDGIAHRSHPWLIWRLCRSLGIADSDMKPAAAVIDFINTLESAVDEPMRALGVLGIGNERMLLAEYAAVQACFDAVCPEADYRDFLRANIGEDETHTQLIGNAAVAMLSFGYSAEEFIRGAREGVAARVAYYDRILADWAPGSG